MLWKIYVCARTLVRQLPDLPDRLLYGPASLHIACPKKLEAASRSSKTYMAIRTVEEDLRQFNLGLASGLRRAQNRTVWRTLTGTATSPTSSDWWWWWSDKSIEILIKVLESRLTVFSAHTNVIKITIPKDELLLGGGIRHARATLQYHSRSN